MQLFIATDNYHRKNNIWLVGATKESSVDKIKARISSSLDETSIHIDLLSWTPYANKILRRSQRELAMDNSESSLILVKGDHYSVAKSLDKFMKEEERKHLSLSRSFIKWFNTIEC